jgi:2-amino-4-hydroxy-6-hydroxymethyldihydropteridine diphosphokinase
MTKITTHIAYLALGSNLGDRLNYLSHARELLSSQVSILKTSPVYETEPLTTPKSPQQNWHLNQVIRVTTTLTPEDLLTHCQNIETQLGRNRKGISPASVLRSSARPPKSQRNYESEVGVGEGDHNFPCKGEKDCEAGERGLWCPRTIDIDILLYNDLTLETPTLKIPHPGIAHRNFVLYPLESLCPNLIIPGTTQTVSQLKNECQDTLKVKRYE